jgi:hypothetical protein
MVADPISIEMRKHQRTSDAVFSSFRVGAFITTRRHAGLANEFVESFNAGGSRKLRRRDRGFDAPLTSVVSL